jgi:hypothetical protein
VWADSDWGELLYENCEGGLDQDFLCYCCIVVVVFVVIAALLMIV